MCQRSLFVCGRPAGGQTATSAQRQADTVQPLKSVRSKVFRSFNSVKVPRQQYTSSSIISRMYFSIRSTSTRHADWISSEIYMIVFTEILSYYYQCINGILRTFLQCGICIFTVVKDLSTSGCTWLSVFQPVCPSEVCCPSFSSSLMGEPFSPQIQVPQNPPSVQSWSKSAEFQLCHCLLTSLVKLDWSSQRVKLCHWLDLRSCVSTNWASLTSSSCFRSHCVLTGGNIFRDLSEVSF